MPQRESELDFTIENLGGCYVDNPIDEMFSALVEEDDHQHLFTDPEHSILYNVYANKGEAIQSDRQRMEKAGPRRKIYFNPAHTHAAIVTCGGLCPGLNDVIRSLVRTLWYNYGVRRISGVRYGYKGFLPEYHLSFMALNPDIVDNIHQVGGTILGSARGGAEVLQIVDSLERNNINMLFAIGGDGTQRGAAAIADEVHRRGLKISVVGIPKTIDNDIDFVERSFGFETSVQEAVHVVTRAHVEAKDALNGISLVKVMGRHSGFIASHTALASNDVNFCLIPEVPFELDGPEGLLEQLKERLEERHHVVILVAEGAAQDLIKQESNAHEKDESGNVKLRDVGIFLKEKIENYFNSIQFPYVFRYIDPSYIIRSAAANANDSLYCARLGANAVHAAMAGKTKMIVSLWSSKFVHVPISMVIRQRKIVKVTGSFWRDVLTATRQPVWIRPQRKRK